MKIRHVALLMGALLIAAAPAQAQSTVQRTAIASAQATAAQLTVNGQGLQIGHVTAALRSDDGQKGVCGDEAGVISCATAAAGVGFNDSAAKSSGAPQSDDKTAGALPEDFSPLLTGTLGQSVSKAEAGKASGDAGVVHLELTATKTLAESAPQIQDGLRDISEQILGPIAESDPSGEVGPRLKGTIDQLIDNLSANPLLSIDLLPAHAEVADSGSDTVASAVAAGAVIVISPTDASIVTGPEGLIIIEVGSARATASAAKGADGNAAVVALKVWNPVKQAYDVVPVSAGDYQCGGQEPLVACVGAGATAKSEDGKAIRAGGISIRALKAPLPEIVLEIGAVEASAAGAIVEPPCPDAACLPHTGGGMALPALALLGVSSGATALIRRRSA